MASTRVHDSSILLTGITLTGLGLWNSMPHLLYVAGGVLFGGLWLSPDLDWGPGLLINGEVKDFGFDGHITREIYNKRLIWGVITRRWLFLSFWWKVFAFITIHRGVSHFPFVGLIIRSLWVAPLTIAITYFLWPNSVFVWVGFIVADMLHLMLDGELRTRNES